MKIILDPQIFNWQKYGGISRYYTEIFASLKKNDKVEIDVPLIVTPNIYFSESSLINNQQRKWSFFLKILMKFLKKTKEINFKKARQALEKQDFDLFIPTYYDPYFLDQIGSKPFVLTVYDMVHELFSQKNAGDMELIKNKLLLIEKATKIIAVSNNTKKDILNIYPHIPESKIHVVYHGNSIVLHKNAKKELPSKYILFIGPRFLYKNFRLLVEQIEETLKNDPSLFLVCAGGGKFRTDDKEFLANLKLDKQVIHVDFEENQLGLIYNKAICLVFPSIYEGFGIPILEAMACGCPVVLGRHSSLPEVAGDAGVYFNLDISGDLVNKILTLVQNKELRNEYSLKGLEQAKKFNWDQAAIECLNVYKEALK